VMMLAEHFLAQHGARFDMPREGFTDEARQAILGYPWPGNVRELSHVVESSVLASAGPHIEAHDLNLRLAVSPPAATASSETNGAFSIHLDFNGHCPPIANVEHRIIKAAMAHTGNNLSRTARLLGLTRDAVRYRLEKYSKQEQA